MDLEPTTVILRTNSAGTQTSTTATYGNNVNLFATVTPNGSGSPSPGGIVEVWTGATKLAQGTITNLTTGRVTIPTPTSGLMLGANSLYARYVPPSTHAVSVSNSVTVTVNPRSTSVAVATSVIEAAFGQAITIGAAVTPAGAPGHLQVLSGATVVAEGPAVNGRLLVAVDDLPLGVHSLSATFTSSVPEYLSSVSPLFLNVPVTIVEGAPRGTWTRTVIDHEHVDAFSATLDGGALHLGTRIDFDGTSKTPLPKYGNNRERIDPAGAVFHLPDMVSIGLGAPGGRKTIPDHPDYAFLGTPGDTIWVAPASNDITPFLYAGFEAESISSGQLFDNRIDIVLVGVDAPPGGRFEAYSGGFSSVWRMLSSTDPLYSSTPFGTGSHDHFNWVFTQLGTYVLHVKAIATLPDGTALESGVIDYTWVVGDLQSAPSVAVNDDAGVVGAAALTATVAPAAEGYVEFRDEGGALIGFAPVMGGIATFPVDFAAGTFTVTAHFLPAALDLYLPASSEATEVSVSL